MTSFLAKNGTQILLQPPYFPDIAPNDFFLFPKLKAVLKGRHFDTRDDIIEKSPLALKSIPKEAYKNCFDNWEKRWRWCVEARGDYFEKSLGYVGEDASSNVAEQEGVPENVNPEAPWGIDREEKIEGPRTTLGTNGVETTSGSWRCLRLQEILGFDAVESPSQKLNLNFPFLVHGGVSATTGAAFTFLVLGFLSFFQSFDIIRLSCSYRRSYSVGTVGSKSMHKQLQDVTAGTSNFRMTQQAQATSGCHSRHKQLQDDTAGTSNFRMTQQAQATSGCHSGHKQLQDVTAINLKHKLKLIKHKRRNKGSLRRVINKKEGSGAAHGTEVEAMKQTWMLITETWRDRLKRPAEKHTLEPSAADPLPKPVLFTGVVYKESLGAPHGLGVAFFLPSVPATS
ncbi:hypothetical protein LAZ67_6002362 [Cordylochernes scorpioides]|uniref:Transposase n=1 Tax=Cordylochernes scorpioides TaxID=51811 RepID=A0ABY6KMV9_9ARAC|nr:hypothetical protein LAZ67_6002362 [Cordylochernes scorpioides]